MSAVSVEIIVAIGAGAGVLAALAFRAWRAERRAMREELARTTASVEERNRVKADFLSMVGHEIRTPLNGVVGMTTLLARTPLDASQRALLDQIGRSAEHMTRLVDDLLDFAFIEAGRVDVRLAATDLVEVAEDVVDDLAPRARAKRIALDLHVDVDAPRLARADEARLRRVLRTLVENAIEFTQEGSVLVRLSRADEGRRLRCAVADTGVGISADKLARLVTEKVTLDADTSRASPRLGVRIVRALLERMGSELDVTSKPGAGSVFSFELPAEREPEEDEARASTTGADPLPLRALIAASDSTSARVLRDHSSRLGLRADVIDRLSELPARIAQAANTNDPYRIGFIELDPPAAARIADALSDVTSAHATRRPALVAVAPSGAERAALDDLEWLDDSVTRPLGPRRLEAVTRRCIAVQEGARDRGQSARAAGDTEQILIAEDHETNRLVALGYVQHLGFRGRVVTSGAETVAAVTRDDEGIDAVLLDADMPDGDGIEATRAIRAWEAARKRPPVPIIIVTAHAAKFYEAEALGAGATAYLRKPIRIEQIGRLLYRLFGRRRDRRSSQPDAPPETKSDILSVTPLDAAILADLRMLAHAGDDQFLLELLESFRSSSTRLLEELGVALEARDFEGIRRRAHQLKGGSRTLGATRLGDVFHEMEQARDVETLDRCLTRARAELPLVLTAFERFAQSASAA